jgi:anti-sigma-K factor RskA
MWWTEPRRAGYFVASGLPAVPAGKTYQLWVVVAGGKPVSAGVFPVDPRGEAALRVGPMPAAEPAEIFAVTLEPAGGLPAPSGPMYLAGKNI